MNGIERETLDAMRNKREKTWNYYQNEENDSFARPIIPNFFDILGGIYEIPLRVGGYLRQTGERILKIAARAVGSTSGLEDKDLD